MYRLPEDAALDAELAALMRGAMRRIAFAAALLYAVFMILNALDTANSPQVRVGLVLLDVMCFVYNTGLAIALRRRVLGLRAVHVLAYLLVVTSTLNANGFAWLRGDTRELFYIGLAIVGMGAVATYRRATLIMSGLLAGSAITSGAMLGDTQDIVWTIAVMVACAVIGAAVFEGRMDTWQRLLATRAREAEQRAHQKALEGQLAQVQKLEAIGTLAGGVAHDLNNVLAAIVGLAELGVEDQPEGTQVREDFGQILIAAQRGATLTRNLLGFARRGKQRQERLALNTCVEEIAELLARTTRKGITIETRLDEQPLTVLGDPAQLGHVIMNLCINAIDAIEGDGTLVLRTSTTTLADGDSAVLAAGSYATLEVIDSGKGMDDATLARAFEPFFTTKSDRGGTGLGLPMVFGTVRDHGGQVVLASTPGKGTTATIHLPAVEPGTSLAIESSPKASQRMRKPVLVIDDEAMVRRAVRRILDSAKIESVEAESGAAGLDLFRRDPRAYSLVILDLAMPGMTGAECFAHLRAVDRSIPVVIVSGFSKDQNVDRLLSASATAFLPKPFQRDSLMEAMARVATS